IRRSNIVAGEAGAITQHIGAYEVEAPTGNITFLDTPGHEAFTAMRARGAQVTDIVVIVVAADERVMPQTVEAIDHARAADVPIIVAINKIDLPTANIDRIKQDLANHGLIPDEWGGNTVMVPVSAKTGEGIDHLLEVILLQAEEMNLRAPRDGRAGGVVIESRLEQGRGVVITVLVEKGKLKVGDPFVAGVWYGRVRAMFNERRKRIDLAYPSSPVEILGSQGIPQAGDSFIVTRDEQEAKEIAAKRQILQREKEIRRMRHVTLEDLRRRVDAGEIKELRIIAKADVDGSLEALGDVVEGLGRPDVGIKVIHKGIGPINESDVLLAAASDAVVIGFHVGMGSKARDIARRENVDVRTYRVIYELVRDIESALDGLLGPLVEKKVIGVAEVRKVFDISGVGRIAGCYVKQGKVSRDCTVRVIRDGEVIYEGKIGSLKRFKDDVREVTQGYECGISIDGFDEIEEGETLEFVVIEEVPRG
ncbi:MAG: translation initiation factor IF-2, partial [bacterium]